MRIGIIGVGTHGSRYANHIINDMDELELAAISRRSPDGKDQAVQWNCGWHQNWRKLVADRSVEAVITVVPPALNLEIARVCVRHGKPLLMEKPLAISSADASEIVAHCRANKLPLTVGQTLRYNPVVQEMRQQLSSIGTLCSFSANQRLEPSSLAWHEDPELAGAGVSFHTAVHVFDALRFITGLEVQRVIAVVRRQHNAALEDLLAVLIQMEQNVVGTIDCSKIGHARSGRYEFVGYDGQMHGDQVHNTLEFIHGSDIRRPEMSDSENTIIPLLKDWNAFLKGKGHNPVTGEDGLAAVRLCEACLESSRNGNWVVVE